MRFKLDENMPRDAATRLRDEGYDVETVIDEGLGGDAPPPALREAFLVGPSSLGRCELLERFVTDDVHDHWNLAFGRGDQEPQTIVHGDQVERRRDVGTRHDSREPLARRKIREAQLTVA